MCGADLVVDEVMETASVLVEQCLPEAVAPLRPALGEAVLDMKALLAALEGLAVALGLVMTDLEAA